MLNTVKEIFVGAWSILVGMGVTFKYIFKRPVTLQYPYQPAHPSNVHKGRIRFVVFPETNTHDCIACLKCKNICPSNCFLEITGEKPPEGGKKRATKFINNFSTCSLCSLCIEACPTKTLEHSPEFNLASEDKKMFIYDFLKEVDERNEQTSGTASR